MNALFSLGWNFAVHSMYLCSHATLSKMGNNCLASPQECRVFLCKHQSSFVFRTDKSLRHLVLSSTCVCVNCWQHWFAWKNW